jgi:GTP-binding protein
MSANSAVFKKGLTGPDEILGDGTPQIAFIGRSNVGKSSLINSLTGAKDLARTSSFPGRTKEINVFLINKKAYFVDLPGYGFAKLSREHQVKLQDLINWYFFKSGYEQKHIVLIIDAGIGPTVDDLEMLRCLEDARKNIIVVANKVDKIKSSQYAMQMKNIQNAVGKHTIVPYSSEEKIGAGKLMEEIMR